jgi:hydrogenase nickel incorporation protein HypA/HybF
MHEYGMVESLLCQVDENVHAQAGQRATRIVIGMTGATAAEERLLQGAFARLKAGTTADTAELVVERTPFGMYCLDCCEVSALADGVGRRCAHCGSNMTLPTDRHDVCLKSVEIEV